MKIYKTRKGIPFLVHVLPEGFLVKHPDFQGTYSPEEFKVFLEYI